jgi:hypothetical protein
MIAKITEAVKAKVPLMDRETLRDLTAVASMLIPLLTSGLHALQTAMGGH